MKKSRFREEEIQKVIKLGKLRLFVTVPMHGCFNMYSKDNSNEF